MKRWLDAARASLEFADARRSWASGFVPLVDICVPAVVGVAMGRPGAGFVAAVVGMFLALLDPPGPLLRRCKALVAVGIAVVLGGLSGAAVHGQGAPFWASLLVFGFLAGWIQGVQLPVVLMGRYATLAFVVAGTMSIPGLEALVGVAASVSLALVTLVVEDRFRPPYRGPSLPGPVPVLFEALRRGPAGPRFALVYSLAIACGLLVGELLAATRPAWVAITTMVVLQPDPTASHRRIFQRVIGTAVGVLAAQVVTWVLRPGWALVAPIVALAFGIPHGLSRNYWLLSAIVAALVLLLLDFSSLGRAFGPALLVERVNDTLLGGVIALGATFAAGRATTSKD